MATRSRTVLGRAAAAALAAAAVAFLGFVAGAIATLSESPPGRVLSDAYKAGRALHYSLTADPGPYHFDVWRAARTDRRGVTLHDPARAQQGHTLYTAGDAPAARLVDMEGRPVHEWRLPFSAVWDASAAVRRPQPDHRVYIEKAHPFPNGDLLALYVAVHDTPWGYGLVRMDRDSRPLWTYLAGHPHHDLDVAPDGTIYVLTQEIGTADIPGRDQLKAPRVDDFVTVLSPEGRELKRVDILQALLRSPHARLLDTVPWYIEKGYGDYLHTNAIELLDGTRARKLPQATAGRVMLSMREIGVVAILDLAEERFVWATRGPWLMQHDPDLLPDGNVLLFDNQGGAAGPGGISRVVEFDPATLQIVWSYAGTPDRPFESEVRSSQQRLPNGNTLVTESDGARLFEVTRAGEVVWEYVTPVRARRDGEDRDVVPILSRARRIDPAWWRPGALPGAVAGPPTQPRSPTMPEKPPEPAPSLAAPREAREVLAATHGQSARGEEARRVAEALRQGGTGAPREEGSARDRPPPERAREG